MSMSPLCGAQSLHLKYKLLHIHTTGYKIDKQQDLLYSTGNYTQYFVIIYMVCIRTYNIQLNNFAAYLKLTKDHKSTTLQ